MLSRFPAILVLASYATLWSLYAAEPASASFYKNEVYPILKQHCFECHGGGEKLKGEFRLTSRTGLLHGGELGAAYNESDPATSLILKMIRYESDEHQMPPRGKLSEGEILTLTQWISDGAPYEPSLEINAPPGERRGFSITEANRNWWAYRPLTRDALPTVSSTEWSGNGIDRFIKHRLDQLGLTPNPPASPQVLIRRLTYDLTGLPPTLAEVNSFVSAYETAPQQAYQALVDELLARPQYGEKWARHWLDLVRYAETNGFERDPQKPAIWRYRDYVVDALNSDKPYDQFVIEQLAGDEIAEPTMASLVATGYHRLMQWDDEPADREQHSYDVLADNVQVTSETFLATTIGCARCHDHKADPISQRDYYSFMDFFHGLTNNKNDGTLVYWASDADKAAFAEERDKALVSLRAQAEAQAAEILRLMAPMGSAAGVDNQNRVTLIPDAREGGVDWTYTVEQPSPDWMDVGYINKSWTRGRSGFGKEGTPGAIVKTNWNTHDIWMRTTFGLDNLPESLFLTLHHDEAVEIYLNGTRIHEAVGYTTSYESIPLPAKAIALLQTGKNILAVHCQNTGGGQYIDASLSSHSGTTDLLARLTGKGSQAVVEQIKQASGRNLVGDYKKIREEIQRWQTREAGTPLHVATEQPGDIRTLHIHLRGSAHALGDAVLPAFPAVLASADSSPLPAEIMPVEREGRTSSGRRLALAEWIVDPGNPLTARVMVNRLWQHHFGRGIAPSSSDFGKLGEQPTHPELLDWLAAEFMSQGWSLKTMHRMMVMSQAYRMSSEPSSASLETDPQNIQLWRYPMRRLTAEEILDSIHVISGGLNLQLGGEWVFPPLPSEILATASRPDSAWPISPDPGQHNRRAIYTHVKRSLRHPFLAEFDQADTDSACAVRFTTTVPTQALSMLNSSFLNDQARRFSDHLRRGGGTLPEQIERGLEIAFQREAHENEVAECLKLAESLQQNVGLSQQSAMERVALAILNLNEFLYLD
jgi:Protein of unknown function (DUF1553)/Protein of unknown function (DUF1549)/Planctomycete cytochrome C